MPYPESDLHALSAALAPILEGEGDAVALIQAAGTVLPFSAAFCVVYDGPGRPIYLGDTYPEGPAKQAVQTYVAATYLLNPVYNAYLTGLSPGLHRMADLAPDDWERVANEEGRENGSGNGPAVLSEPAEEIGFRTPGWPAGLQELSLTVDLPDDLTGDLPGGAMGEISFARPSAEGGFTADLVARLAPFHPLFAVAFRKIWAARAGGKDANAGTQSKRLEDFAKDRLTTREAEIVQLILKGHSSLSIALTLEIALPTVKTHRRNAYAKLGIGTQQQLFTLFLDWQGEG